MSKNLVHLFFRGPVNSCRGNHSTACCMVPTIRWERSHLISLFTFSLNEWGKINSTYCVFFQLKWNSGTRKLPLYSLDQCWILSVWVKWLKADRIVHIHSDILYVITTAISSLVLLFCIFHHAHIMERHACHSMLSKIALIFGVVAAMGAFAAGNCNVSSAPINLAEQWADRTSSYNVDNIA